MSEPSRRLARWVGIAIVAITTTSSCATDDEPEPTLSRTPTSASPDSSVTLADTGPVTTSVAATMAEPSTTVTVAITTTVAPPSDPDDPSYPTTPPRPTLAYPTVDPE